MNGNRSAAKEYLRQHGLDYGVRVRWYVEGDTEYYGLEHILSDYTAIELINLKGHVAQSGGKGVAFRDSLRNDLKAHVFSIISIDGDNHDYRRVLQKAAEANEICGMFFVSEPDFEFSNFSLPELEEILWKIAMEKNLNGRTLSDTDRHLLQTAISGVKSGKELINAAKGAIPELTQLEKGGLWGVELMKFAVENPQIRVENSLPTKTRPVIDALDTALRAVDANYLATISGYRVDPKTGRPVKPVEQ
jgi:hypothetical protein